MKTGYTIKEIKEEIRKMGGSITKRAETLNGNTTYKVEAPGFNPHALYTHGDIVGKLWGV